jgi:hypothetical protein
MFPVATLDSPTSTRSAACLRQMLIETGSGRVSFWGDCGVVISLDGISYKI